MDPGHQYRAPDAPSCWLRRRRQVEACLQQPDRPGDRRSSSHSCEFRKVHECVLVNVVPYCSFALGFFHTVAGQFLKGRRLPRFEYCVDRIFVFLFTGKRPEWCRISDSKGYFACTFVLEHYVTNHEFTVGMTSRIYSGLKQS